jgi:hypothetical protein
MIDNLKAKFEKYTALYNEYKEGYIEKLMNKKQSSFIESFERNKILQDRIMMFYLSFEPQNVKTQEEYQQSQYFITLSNIYMITNTLHKLGKSFILPISLLKKLLDINKIFTTDNEALDFLELYEA